MKADTFLDHAIFELSPKHSLCELFASSNGETEKLASGSIENFMNHLRVLESQSSQREQSSIRLEVGKSENGDSWFTRRTLERFVQFVNSPEVLQRVNTFDSEMSQLEAARTLYSQDNGGVADATKKELLRAIDLRLDAIKKDLTKAIANASAYGFEPQTVSDLQHFADRFGAHHLHEACAKYISLCQRRLDLITKNLNTNEANISEYQSSKNDEEEKKDESSTVKTSHITRRLSVQDRINLFESKQKENSNSAVNKPVTAAKCTELKRLSSDVSSAASVVSEKYVLRRWNNDSDMSFDMTFDNKKFDSSSPGEGPSSVTESEENSKKEATSPNPAGSKQRKQSLSVEDDLKVNLVNQDSLGKMNNNRVCATSVDEIQSIRLSRENKGVNDELKMKANDLEKIFAEHKLRILPGDQPAGPEKDNRNVVMRRNLSELSYSDDSKGKLYEKYMKKRDAKLREEWSSKEMKLKSMQEALEKSRTEMNSKFSASSEKEQDSISRTRQRAENFRSFNSRPSTKKIQSEEEDEKDKQYIGKNASRSSQIRKAPSPNRSSRVSKPSGNIRNTNTSSGRRRTDPVAQSCIPSFADLKKENTKPRSTPMMQTQVKSSNKKTTTRDDILSPVKPRRPRSLRKSFSANIEFTELTTLYSDDMMDKDVSQKQNTDTDDVSEKMKKEEFEAEEEKQVVENLVKEDEEEEAKEMETLVVEDIVDEKPLLSDKMENSSEDETFTSLRSVSQVDLPATTTLPSSTFQQNLASLMDSPSENPLSWNSNLQHAFSYPHDHSDADADASMDYSPMGSPASWSSRMRKKWGTTTQSPVIVSNSSPRKDLARGIKRLLKFGKKTRAADNLMDWVSITTSEGDDDFAYRSSDELRKSRMASSQSQLSEDEQASNNMIHGDHHQASFKVKDGEFKRSFFSLSSFRSNGNESKPR